MSILNTKQNKDNNIIIILFKNNQNLIKKTFKLVKGNHNNRLT